MDAAARTRAEANRLAALRKRQLAQQQADSSPLSSAETSVDGKRSRPQSTLPSARGGASLGDGNGEYGQEYDESTQAVVLIAPQQVEARAPPAAHHRRTRRAPHTLASR